MEGPNVRCVAPVGDQCGEAATWCARERALYWTDVNRFLVHRLDPSTRAVESWYFDEPCVALFPTGTAGELVLAVGSRLLFWQPSTDLRRDHGFVLPDWPVVRLNDGRAGPGGEIWIGTMANNVGADGTPGAVHGRLGVLYRIDPEGRATIEKHDIGIANTVCFSPDRRHFFFGDTTRNCIWRYDYDPGRREIGNATEFFRGFDRGLPDGSTVDAEGYLWNCRFGGGCVVRVAPDGRIDRVVEMPCSNLTTCEFGGDGLATLYVTSAAMPTDRYERLAGSLFALDAPAPGLPPLEIARR